MQGDRCCQLAVLACGMFSSEINVQVVTLPNLLPLIRDCGTSVGSSLMRNRTYRTCLPFEIGDVLTRLGTLEEDQ